MAYYDGEDISAVVFTVPGTDASDTEFSFCVNGFAGGSSVADAPTGGVDGGQTEPIQIGVGNTDSARFARAKVAHEGETYVIQNNYWGNTTGSQVLEYFNNSFEVLSMSNDGASCNGCPVSFPSIFIGASGNTQNGQFSTRSTDNLPAAISAITSVNTSVRWSGSPGSAANAAYDIWFASPSRGDLTGKRYNDGLDGFIMLWLHNPGSHVPIGQNPVETKTIAGSSWQVWVGPRGTGPSGEGADLQADGAAPVISYVATSAMNTFNGDLKPFFEDAIGRQNQGSKAFAADLLLTDVFFGFEIWNPVTGLKVDSFTAVVEK
jgi:hypothetical protein